ncbi:MAG: L-serine ammonia-lyase [Pseudomonadota bacterium]|nr:L-serine ammonia-lyase [Pseudomonadota bacterium]
MFISTFDIFKIGIGPSSSHTMGPMTAASRFIEKLRNFDNFLPGAGRLSSIRCTLYGSLALTGDGHQTKRAVTLGLCGLLPNTAERLKADSIEQKVNKKKRINFERSWSVRFDPNEDIIYDYRTDKFQHPNVLEFRALDQSGSVFVKERYYSIGGGFVATEKEFLCEKKVKQETKSFPFNFSNASEMLQMAKTTNKSIAEMVLENELVNFDSSEINRLLDQIWEVMNSSIENGLSQEGILPGGLKVRRRAKHIYKALKEEKLGNVAPPHIVNDWISVYAIAVNEENASGGRVVTAPTNGAAGVIPAVIRYYLDHVPNSKKTNIPKFLLTAAAIGGLIKTNASISGAEVGCQGEIGSAAAMAAAGLCAALNGTVLQIENAAEIALEHHLGMTCDPIKGLVQAPCIERNGLGAIKAVSAASLALRGDGTHLISLDSCIKTMKDTGRDMSFKYKETALGGLAVNMIEC